MLKHKLSFKWFGSLGNLSFRRKSDVAKGSSQKDDETPIDEEDMRPRCPSYARSSEMYTHMGTMPRPQKKKEKSNKAKSQDHKSLKIKNKTKSTPLIRSQSMRNSDYVNESPLLSALNGKALSSLHENNVDNKLTPEHKKAETREEPKVKSTEQIRKEPDNTRSKPAEDPPPPPDALQQKPVLPRKCSLPAKISVDLQEHKISTISERHQEKEEEERKTGPDPDRQKGTKASQGEYVECFPPKVTACF
ncbi:hypothetical protein AMELA_G00154610 [Ameiurus melas]|uniref:Uncharacterized protein n=1 Tax=Ameiurus melas TaxID=219545 RepID=A0A7J6AIC2_AMEME|nr:hypothetical protein AMELA_G00154610 [Ameiurus melas]